nr:hypothetical protein [Tanacetum cinerariifolium]
MDAKRIIRSQKCMLSREAFTQFLITPSPQNIRSCFLPKTNRYLMPPMEMPFRNFIVVGNDKDLRFVTKNPHEGIFGFGSPSVSVNNDLVEAHPVQSVASAQPLHLVEIYL